MGVRKAPQAGPPRKKLRKFDDVLRPGRVLLHVCPLITGPCSQREEEEEEPPPLDASR